MKLLQRGLDRRTRKMSRLDKIIDNPANGVKDMISWQLTMEAMCLVLDKRWEKVKELLKDDES